MNQQDYQNQTQKRSSAPSTVPRKTAPAVGDPASVHPVRRQRTQKNQMKMRVLQRVMIAVIAMVILVGLLLVVVPMFRVKTIVVEGSSRDSAEIAALLDIYEGDEIVPLMIGGLDPETEKAFYNACPEVSSFDISYSFSKVTISIIENN